MKDNVQNQKRNPTVAEASEDLRELMACQMSELARIASPDEVHRLVLDRAEAFVDSDDLDEQSRREKVSLLLMLLGFHVVEGFNLSRLSPDDLVLRKISEFRD